MLACLAEGLGIRATARVFEVDPNTVLQWLVEAAEQLQTLTSYFLCDVHVTQLQLDELYVVLRGVKEGEISISKVERGVLVSMTTTTLERLVQALHVSADYLLGLSDQAAPAAGAPTAVASQHQAKPTAATSARHAGRTANGRHATRARFPAPASAAQPEPSRSSAMCPHCAMPMQPLDDGHGLACPACRTRSPGRPD